MNIIYKYCKNSFSTNKQFSNFYGSFAQVFSSGCLIRLSLPLQFKDLNYDQAKCKYQ